MKRFVHDEIVVAISRHHIGIPFCGKWMYDKAYVRRFSDEEQICYN